MTSSNHTTKWFAMLFSFLLITQYVLVAADRCHASQQYGSIMCKSESECHVCSNDNDEVREKRVIVTALFVASMITSLASLGFDIYLEIKGCAGIYPSIKKHTDEIEGIRKEIIQISRDMEDQYTSSKNLLVYIRNSNRLNRDIWYHVFRIMELTEEVFQYIDPRLINKFLDKSFELKKEISKHNQTIQQLDFNGLTAEYNGIFSSANNAIKGLLPIVGEMGTFALGKGLKWYKSMKVTKDIQANSAKLVNLGSKGRAILGVKNVNSFITSTASAQSKALSATTKLSRIATAASAAMSVVSIGMDIYVTVQRITACEKMRDTLEDSVIELRPEVAIFNGTYKDVINHHDELEKEYNNVKLQITSDAFFNYLTNLTTLAKSGHETVTLAKAEGEVKSFESKIKKADFALTVDLQQKLIKTLEKFTYTWSCYENQVRIVTFVAEKCSVGIASMETLHEQAVQHFMKVDDCTGAVGEKYTSLAKTKTYAELQMKAQKLNTDCLLNNKEIVLLTCYLNAKGWDYDYIAEETGLNNGQVDYLIRVKTCPPHKLSPNDKRVMCSLKGYGLSLAQIKDSYPKYDQVEVETTYNAC